MVELMLGAWLFERLARELRCFRKSNWVVADPTTSVFYDGSLSVPSAKA